MYTAESMRGPICVVREQWTPAASVDEGLELEIDDGDTYAGQKKKKKS
jgi:hypothetical protein